MLLLINKALPNLDFDALRKRVEEIYKTPVAGILPVSDEMMELGSSDLFCLRNPNHALTQEMEKVAKQIIG
jgi:MinD-like ATPase involved in chromosome partitioning or flagellar assembly